MATFLAAVLITKPDCLFKDTFEKNSLEFWASVSRKPLTFLYCASFRTRYSSFSKSFYPIMVCDMVKNAFLA